MKIFVAGATGVLGRRAVEQLVGAGHQVTAAARSPEKAAMVSGLGATPVEIDVFGANAVGATVRGHDVVMNLATHIPAPAKSAFRSAWKENDRIRRDLSKILVDAAIAAKATRYVQESIAFMYPDRGDAWIDEDVPLDVVKYAATVVDAEAQARRFEAHGTGVVLRFGMFYAADTTHTSTQLRLARTGLSPFIGHLDSYQSTIHLDDAASAVVAALDAPSGTYNVVDDEPLPRGEAAAALAEALGRKRLRKVPGAMLKVGGEPLALLTRSVRVSNERFKKASGWEPRFASVREGFRDVVAHSKERSPSGR